MKYKISQYLLILYGLTEPSDLMWLRLNIAIELSRCATACQGCCAAFSFSNKKAVTRWLK